MKKKILLFLLGFISIICIVFIFTKTKNNNQKTEPQFKSTGVSYNEIIPNKSTKEDLYNSIGDPIKQTEKDGLILFEYTSNNPNYNNEFKLDSEKVTFVKTYITLKDDINVEKINNQYGNYETVLYGPGTQSGSNLYVYNSKGIAYIGNQYTKDITQIWYFPPTDTKTFISKYAPEYSETIKQNSH